MLVVGIKREAEVEGAGGAARTRAAAPAAGADRQTASGWRNDSDSLRLLAAGCRLRGDDGQDDGHERNGASDDTAESFFGVAAVRLDRLHTCNLRRGYGGVGVSGATEARRTGSARAGTSSPRWGETFRRIISWVCLW